MEIFLFILVITIFVFLGAFLQSLISEISDRFKDKYRPNEKTKTLLTVLCIFLFIKSTLLELGFTKNDIVMVMLIIMIFAMSVNNILIAFFKTFEDENIGEVN